MSKVVGEIISVPDGPTPFAAVIRSDTDELMRVFVDTREEGERVVAGLLRNFQSSAPASPKAELFEYASQRRNGPRLSGVEQPAGLKH